MEGRVRMACENCGWVYYNNPLPVVVCVVRNKRNELFVARRNLEPGLNKWALPGGFIESGETSEAACLRELREETGLKGKVEKLLGVYTRNTALYGSLIIVGYEVSVSKCELVLNGELKDAKFVSRENIPYIPFLIHRKMIIEVYSR